VILSHFENLKIMGSVLSDLKPFWPSNDKNTNDTKNTNDSNNRFQSSSYIIQIHEIYIILT